MLKAIQAKDGIILEKENALLEKDDIIDKKSVVIDGQKKRIAILGEYLRLERARHYGRSSEKSSTQGEIFNEVELADCATEPDDDEDSSDQEPPKPRSNCKERKPLSPLLPRYQEIHRLSEEEKQGAIDTFLTRIREELDIIPAKVRVKEILQEKAVFLEKNPEQGEDQQPKRVIKAAGLPKHPIPKSAVTVCMLAWIIVAKYCDALPLYRLEKILTRYGGSITRTTMANWLIRLSLQLQPLINLMMDHQRSGYIMNADETVIQVLKETEKSINSDKYMWITLGGPPGQPSVLFHYDPSRSKEVPLRLFEGFSGYLQTDGYAGYNAVRKQEGITQPGCFDHVRRKFTDAKKGEAKPGKKLKNNKVSNAAAENAIRPFTLGRKNWLFADTPEGAKASAMYYSFIESANANGLEPFEYLSYLLEKLPYADTVEQLDALLPWNVKASGVLSTNKLHPLAARQSGQSFPCH